MLVFLFLINLCIYCVCSRCCICLLCSQDWYSKLNWLSSMTTDFSRATLKFTWSRFVRKEKKLSLHVTRILLFSWVFFSALSLFPRMCDVFQGLGWGGRKGTKDKNKVNWHKARIFNSRFTCNHLHTLVRTRDTTTPENLNKLLWCPICMLNTESCYNDCCFGEWMYIYIYIDLDAMRNVFLVTAAIQPGQGEDRAGNRAAVWSDALLRPRLLPILHTGHHSRVGGGGRGGLIYLCMHIWQCPLLQF